MTRWNGTPLRVAISSNPTVKRQAVRPDSAAATNTITIRRFFCWGVRIAQSVGSISMFMAARSHNGSNRRKRLMDCEQSHSPAPQKNRNMSASNSEFMTAITPTAYNRPSASIRLEYSLTPLSSSCIASRVPVRANWSRSSSDMWSQSSITPNSARFSLLASDNLCPASTPARRIAGGDADAQGVGDRIRAVRR